MAARPLRRPLPALGLLALASCSGQPDAPPVAYDPPAPTLQRLTQSQYQNSIHDVFGSDIVIAGGMEPDTAIDDFFVVGASATSISPRGVEQYESLAYDIAQQALTGDAHRAAIVPCAPTGPADADCAKKALSALGRRLFRRPLTDEETSDVVGIATMAGTTLSDFYGGMQFGIATLLQSPDFLFRAELGVPGAPAGGSGVTSPSSVSHYTGYEMASRLSFFLWDGPPDDALLAAAGSGALDSPDGIAAQVTRMMDSPLAHRGLRNFVSEWLQLGQLDDLVKDPMIFTQASADVGPSAREETLRDAERLVFDLDGDLRDLLTTRDTFLNRKLASIYGVRAPSQDGFALATLPSDQPRRGLLGQLSTLALYAHPTTTSPTLRGKFVRTLLLCQTIPPPPVNLNTAIPAPSATLRTMRERLTSHMQDPFCAGCHKRTDPIGLGLENFDGLGVYRQTENSAAIDAAGDLDGATFSGADSLAQVVHDHAALGPCLARRVYRYGVAHAESDGEEAFIARLGDGFAGSGYHLKKLMMDIARSDAFRRTGAPLLSAN